MFIDFWVLPCDECLYIECRILIFIIYGFFAGLLQGPRKGCFTRGSNGGHNVRAEQYAAHIKMLIKAGRWPAAPARVVCCGFRTPQMLEAVKDLLDPDVAAQLVRYPWSLTCQPGQPTQIPLRRKVRQVVAAVGLMPRVANGLVLTAATQLATAFRSVVYP